MRKSSTKKVLKLTMSKVNITLQMLLGLDNASINSWTSIIQEYTVRKFNFMKDAFKSIA
ncbi:Uncharacterised protein (plasmid) [Klebsiella aerogenes]|nr:Uncharacterised protein [Klebsiella aerogenes]